MPANFCGVAITLPPWPISRYKWFDKWLAKFLNISQSAQLIWTQSLKPLLCSLSAFPARWAFAHHSQNFATSAFHLAIIY